MHISNRVWRSGSGSGDLQKGQNGTPQEWSFVYMCLYISSLFKNTMHIYCILYLYSTTTIIYVSSLSYMYTTG